MSGLTVGGARAQLGADTANGDKKKKKKSKAA
jgi:hypothetical protein